MALRKPRPDDIAASGGSNGGTATALAEPPVAGPSSDECAAVGQALVQAGQIQPDRLALALEEANGDLLKLVSKLLSNYGVARNDLSPVVAAVCQVPLADSSLVELDEEIVTRFPEDVARAHKVMPIADENGLIVLYAADPSPWRRQEVESATGQRFAWKASDEKTVTSFIEQMYRSTSDVNHIVAAFAAEDEQRQVADTIAEVNLDDQAPVVQLVGKIVGQALRDRSSDIHIEPLDDRLRIRFRVDGHLIESFSLPLSAHNALISRLKIMSEMNIVEKRAPQDGQFSTKVDGRPIDVRVSSVATVFGEKIVMRSARQVEVDGQPVAARHAGRRPTRRIPSWCMHRSAWSSVRARPAPARRPPCTPRCSRSTRPART